MGSHFKERLYESPRPLLGMFVKFPTIETIEIMAHAGYDYIIVDMEHAPVGIETVYRMIVTAERSNMAALVRTRGHDFATANTLMDAGASGVLIPHCSPYAVAKELIAEMVFPPTGRRGAGGGGRATQWGLDGAEEYRRGGDHGVIRVPMVEDPEAVEQIEQILDVSGVDAAFIGQGDLTQTLGDRAKAQAMVDKALQACIAKGVPASITAYGDDLEARIKQGFRWIAIGADTGSFTRAVKDRLQVAHQVAESAAGAAAD